MTTGGHLVSDLMHALNDVDPLTLVMMLHGALLKSVQEGHGPLQSNCVRVVRHVRDSYGASEIKVVKWPSQYPSMVVSGTGGWFWLECHRLVCWLDKGEPPVPGMEVHPECEDKACVCPGHLTWKTRSENLKTLSPVKRQHLSDVRQANANLPTRDAVTGRFV